MKKLALIATTLLLATMSGVAFAAPHFIVTAPFSHRANDDPIVFPNQPGAAHSHDFVCATTTNAFSTTSSLEAGGTNCAVEEDHTGYWVPTLYEDGVAVPINRALFYYAQSRNGIPHGLKMITDRHLYKCGPGSGMETPIPPMTCPSPYMLVAVATFPTWWNGQLDSADHRSHLSFTKTATHTQQITQIKGYVRYIVGSDPISVTLSSGPYSTYHADFLEGWIGNSLADLIARCAPQGGCGQIG